MHDAHGISGDSGFGKTRLVDAFTAALSPSAVQWLGAACDPLQTPRPLGPLVDLSPRLRPALAAASICSDGQRRHAYNPTAFSLRRSSR